MMPDKFKRGTYVNVLNSNMRGEIIFEGRAKIVRGVNAAEGRWLVCFGDDGSRVERYIDPRAQLGSVYDYIRELNSKL